ncbi:MAG: peptidoglycan-binding protein [Clostridia bacterium]|nr:peptidoglycan-binding protein [Clostridia bacterium]
MTLRSGDTGSLVEALQLGLIRSGFLSGEPDGIFGENTRQAVLNFQRAFSLVEDGIAGNETINFIERFIKGYYIKTVQKGESLWSISVMTGTPINKIITANPNIDPELIFPGDKIIVPFDFELIPTNLSYSSYLTDLLIDGLITRYPFISRSTIGTSVMGKPLSVLTIGNGNNQIFINAGFHSNEWLNIPTVLKFTEEYLEAFVKNQFIEGTSAEMLYNETSLHLVPLVNPDGLDLVTGALNEGEYYTRATEISASFPNVPFPQGWKANINGVDLNLQYPAGWENAREIKFSQGFTRPSPIEYVGSAPLTEPEAIAVYNYTLTNNFRIILAYHSQGSIIYWKYQDFLPPESERIGNILSDASGYPLEITPPDSSFAGYKDWFIQEYNRPGYTIETGRGTNPLPIEQFDEIYAANKKLIAAALRETADI